jgi:hypothetical protein
VMAKDLVRTRHQIEKFYKLKSQLQGVSLRIQVCCSFLYACNVFLPNGMHFFYLSKINLSTVPIAQGLYFPTMLAEHDCGYLLSARKLVAFCYLRI